MVRLLHLRNGRGPGLPRGVFPPDLNPVLGTIVAFGTTSFGYVGRPIGAFIFGHLGDRHGRKPVLIATLLLMGLGTFGIGLLPSYANAGAIAPILLITLRLLQGVAMGGEWGGAALLSIEHAPANRRAFFGSFAQLGSSVGATLSAVIFAIAERLDGGLEGGNWRIPFLFSLVLVIVGLAIRSMVDESPEFVETKARDGLSSTPIADVFSMRRRLLVGVGAMVVATGGYYVTSSFFLTYANEEAGVPVSDLLNGLVIAGLFEMAFIPVAGLIADRWRPQYAVMIGIIGVAVAVVPLYLLTHTGSFLVICVALCVTAIFTAFNYGPIAAVLASIFPTRVGYTGISLAYQGAALTAGALTPIILPSLLGIAGGSPILIFGYLAALCTIACSCVLATRRLDVTSTPATLTESS